MQKRSPKQHYTQLTSHVRTAIRPHDNGSVFEIHGRGIVSPAMIDKTLGQWDDGCTPPNLLVDLRDVAGYEAGSIRAANQWLDGADEQGVRKIALLASSTVLATAARLASERSGVALRTFDDERAARAWLTGTPPEAKAPVPLPNTTSRPLRIRL